MTLILWGKSAGGLGFTLTREVSCMENLTELCGSDSFLLSCDNEDESFPLGLDARSGF